MAIYFQLSVVGREGAGLFTGAHGGGSENAVIEQKVANPDGTVTIRKIPGNLKFNDITLKRGVDPDRMLWDWRQLVVDGKFREARANGTIQILDSLFTPLATYSFENGWVSKYTPAMAGIAGDEVAVEEITIVIENFKRE